MIIEIFPSEYLLLWPEGPRQATLEITPVIELLHTSCDGERVPPLCRVCGYTFFSL